MQPRAYAVFHLNLAFSSIEAEARSDVVARCYQPLLDLVESGGIPLGVELSGWTLEQLHQIAPDWVERLSRLVEAGACELIGSGYTQIIGPLVPHDVNVWNQRLGIKTYERLLGVRPRIVLVNEMAFAASLVDLYSDAGYEGMIMERDNVRLALGAEDRPVADAPTHAVGPDGASLPILWADSILFQKLQHFAHGDIRRSDYLEYVASRIESGEQLIPLYANDAEVFDFRPGRFGAESGIHTDGEWGRIQRIWKAVTDVHRLEWVSPSTALDSVSEARPSSLTSAAYPIPVKKQAKYNLGRWAITGRGDMWLNTMCHRLTRELIDTDSEDSARWRWLCELWATDLRTHITEARWAQALDELSELAAELGVALGFDDQIPEVGVSEPPAIPGVAVTTDGEGIMLDIATEHLRLTLNLRRGLAVHSLGFASQGFEPVVGTVPHGFFSSIALGADFYTGGVVVELPGEHRRITDLEWVEPMFELGETELQVRVEIPTSLGPIVKIIGVALDDEAINLGYWFPGWERPLGTIRAGKITLIPRDQPMSLSCVNGGSTVEAFTVDRTFDHAAATSSLISTTAGLGATDGRIVVGGDAGGVAVEWDPTRSAVFPMVTHRRTHPAPLTRIVFSLLELDDTARTGGPVGPFEVTIRSSR